jgi:DNA-binding NarL/FixJ family response regulator
VDCGGPVLVADGDDACRALVTALLARIGYSTIEATDGYEALALTHSERPSLVLLDVELSGITGYETCRELRDRFGTGLPIVFLSGTRIEPLDRIAGLLIGADDYVVKPFEPDELLARVRALLRRRYDTNAAEPNNGPAVNGLTPRERQVLDLLAAGHSQDQIAGELFITRKTVATHIQRVLAKLGVHSRAQAVALALGNRRNGHSAPPGLAARAAPVELELV